LLIYNAILTKKSVILGLLLALASQICFGWGFYSHKLINKQAVYSLPEGTLFGFFKKNIGYLTEKAVNPDQRRNVVPEEACRHYIDFEAYERNYKGPLPKYWSEAVKAFSEDSLNQHGIVPWHIFRVQKQLTKAMTSGNTNAILRLAADIGHYIGDANVPLHTTMNYDGQFTNQKGIHSLWETRIPELLSTDYDYLVGKAEYVKDVQAQAWKAVYSAHAEVDSVLKTEERVTKDMPEEHKFTFEEKNNYTIRVYSREFSEKYSEALNGQVERQMQKAIKMVADIWYTSWIEAGQPDLMNLLPENNDKNEDEEKSPKTPIKNNRFLESYHSCGHDHTFLVHEIIKK